MRCRAWTAATVAGLVALSLPAGWAKAGDVIVTPPQQPASSTTVIVPAPAPVTGQVVPASPQVVMPQPPRTIRANEIEANQVRADTIYANRIEANHVVGQVHQSKDVDIGETTGEIEAPEVVASTIYADEIEANSVTAQHIFVRELRRK
jgi:hypothetical protein